MKMLILIFVLGLLSLNTVAQITFQKTIDRAYFDAAGPIHQTNDGGYIIVGSTADSLGDFPPFGVVSDESDVYLIKIDSNGDTLWTKTFGEGSNEVGLAVQQTDDGGYIITGWTESFGVESSDVYLIKTDANGNELWAKTFGGAEKDNGIAIQQTNDEGYIIAGWTDSYGAGGTDIYLVKTDENGDSIWTKVFGGTIHEEAAFVHQTSDSGFVVIGSSHSIGAGGYDFYLLKTDKNGDSLWSKSYGGSQWDVCRSARQTSDGGYILTGYTASFGAGQYDIFLVKTNENGDSLWAKTFGGTIWDWGYSVWQTTDDGYIISGLTGNFGAGRDDVYLIRTDENGDSLWTKTYGGVENDVGYSVQQTSDGGYIICGTTLSFGGVGSDVYLIKTDADGNIITGIVEQSTSLNNINVYPNPFSYFTTIVIPNLAPNESESLSITFFDVLGKRTELHHKMNLIGNRIEIKIERGNLSDGIYFYQLMRYREEIGSGKLIVQKNAP